MHIVKIINKETRYTQYLPDFLPLHWRLMEVDEEHWYIEFTGYDNEFLLSIGYHPHENPSEPFEVFFAQLKGAFSRFDYDRYGIYPYAKTEEEATKITINVMHKVNDNYHLLLPVTNEYYVSLGAKTQFDQIKKSLGGELKCAEGGSEVMVYKLVAWDPLWTDKMIKSISFVQTYINTCAITEKEFIGGRICNEKFQFIAQVGYDGRLWDNEDLSIAKELDTLNIQKNLIIK